MDDIRQQLASALPDLALTVRRDGTILSCLGGNAVRGLAMGPSPRAGPILFASIFRNSFTHVAPPSGDRSPVHEKRSLPIP